MILFPSFSSSALLLTLTIVIGVLTCPVTPSKHCKLNRKRGNSVLTGPDEADSLLNGRYILVNNLWGMDTATGGWQKSEATGTGKGYAVVWKTQYDWEGNPGTVKSYANLDVKRNIGQRIDKISAIHTILNWHYGAGSTSSNLVANVAYDLWLSPKPGFQGAQPSTSFEIMIWLSARGGPRPVGSKIGTAKIGGRNWSLYKGTVKTWTVFSFVPPSEIPKFTANLKPFLTHLVNNEGVPSNQYLVQAQGGTEAFVGSATLFIDWYTFHVVG